MVAKRAYPDTPLGMHYRPFEEIDWCTLLGADEVVLVITPVFCREVNDHKDRHRGTLQQRARRMSHWLGELRKTKNSPIRPGVRVEVNTREPEVDVDFAAHGLEPSVNDDKIVACMVRDAGAHPGVPLVCVTPDLGLSYKVEGAGFEAVEPPDDLRLPDEPDPAEREKRDLQKQIVELKKRLDHEPDLALRFDGDDEHVASIKLSGLEAPTKENIDEEIEAERAGLQLRHRFGSAIMKRPPSEQAVERYLEELRAWMRESTKVAIKHAHTFDLRLVLVNAGLGNANGIEIDLTFPNNVFVAETRKLPEIAKRPTAPEPEDVFSLLTLAKFAAIPPTAYLGRDFGRLQLRTPERIDEGGNDPHRLRVLVDLAKHQSSVVLPKFQAWFGGGQRPTNFKIDYRSHAVSNPKIKTGTLHVKVEVREGPYRFFHSKLGRPEPDEEETASQEEVDEILSEAVDVTVSDDDQTSGT